MPISFPGTDYFKKFNDYYQPFSSDNLPYTVSAIVGLGTVAVITGLYLNNKFALKNRNIQPLNATSPRQTLAHAHFGLAQSSEDITNTLRAIGNRKIHNYSPGAPSKDFLDGNLKPYLRSGEIDKSALFKQVDHDLNRNSDGKIAFILNGQDFKGNAESLYRALKQKTGKADEEICAVMSLLHQGIFANTQGMALQHLQIIEAGFNLESTKDRDIQCGEYRITTEGKDIKIACWRDNYVQSVRSESPTHSDGPHAILRTCINLNLLESRWSGAEEYWTITKVL